MPLGVGKLVRVEIGSWIFLINFWDLIVFSSKSDKLNLLLSTVPEKETYNSLAILEVLLQILKVLISTFLTKYSPAVISNLLSSSPGT